MIYRERFNKRGETVMVLLYEDSVEDYNPEEDEDNQALDTLSEEDREVFIDKSQMSIFELHRRYKRGDLDLRPSFQRKDVWNKIKKSKLIESVLRNIPIPAIYLSEKDDSSWEVIDGQQRLRAFFDFLDDGYEMGKLPVLSSLTGSNFTSLDTKYQRRIEDYQLHIFIIKKESHPDIKFDIFERINEGASQLNAQELRNCIFRGEGIELIRKLAKDKEFKKVIGKKLQTSRSKDEEIVLRFLSLYLKGYEAYSGNLNMFLNDTLRNFHSFKDKLIDIEKKFENTMSLIYEVFGENAFIKNGPDKKNDGNNKINISLFDILTVSFTKYEGGGISSKKLLIAEKMNELVKDREFYEAITFNTLTKNNMEIRFRKWYKAMEEIMEEKHHD